MNSFSIFCVIMLGASVASAQVISPRTCRSQELQCVGQGETCSSDVDSSCSSATCRKCADDTLTCDHGLCWKRLASEGDICNGQTKMFCKAGLSCSAGVCTKSSNNIPVRYKDFGEPCTPYGNECVSGICDITTGVCTLLESAPESREYLCDSSDECPWGDHGMHCGENLKRERVCKDNLPLNDRLNRPCSVDGECGHLYSCIAVNPLEDVPAFIKRVCNYPYSLTKGEPCVGSDMCGKDLLCSASICVKAELRYEGYGCDQSVECGTFLECGCPNSVYNGRQMCHLTDTMISHNAQIDYAKSQRAIAKCLESNKCQNRASGELTCAQRNCYKSSSVQARRTCSLSSPYYSTDYIGIDMSIGSIARPAEAWFATLFVLVAALLYV